MIDEPTLVNWAPSLKLPSLALTVGAGMLAAASLAVPALSDTVLTAAILVVSIPAAALFLTGAFDGRIRRATSVYSAQRRGERRVGYWKAWWPAGDRLLRWSFVPLIVEMMIMAALKRGGAALLCFAACYLLGMVNLGFGVRGVPTDRYAGFMTEE